MQKEIFDVVIIGGGVAGLSAALWCDELGLDAILLESSHELGGQLLWTFNAIENHLGVKAENGRQMRDIFVEQAKERKFEIRLDTIVKDVDLANKTVFINDDEAVRVKAIVIATGIKRRELNVEGEKEFRGKGIISSGKKEGKLVKDKTVAIIGGGDAAFENCQILSEYASKIYLIHRSKEFRARDEFVIPAKENEKVTLLTETAVEKIIGNNHIEALELKDKSNNEIYKLETDFVLLRIGVQPNTELFKGQLDLDERGYVEVDSRCETSIEQVYAIGDVANPASPTISTAVGMGATAIKALFSQLKK